MLEMEVRSIAPSLAQSTGLQLTPEELAPLLVGSEGPVAGHDGESMVARPNRAISPG